MDGKLMTFQTGTGITQIETDDGVAFINSDKPNFKVIGQNGTTTEANGNEVIFKSTAELGGVETFLNLGFSYDSNTGVFTLHSSDGTNLNDSNGFVRIWDSGTNTGTNRVYTIDQNFRFIDASGSSQINGNLFGKLSGDNWNEDMPMYIYAVANATNSQMWFAIARHPFSSVSPVLSGLGSSASTTANLEPSFYFLEKFDGSNWINPNLSNFAETSCRPIGNFLMRTSGVNDWQVQALTPTTTIGTLALERGYNMPKGVLNSASNSFFQDIDTPPVFQVEDYKYYLSDGFVWANFSFRNVTNGSGGGITRLTIPLKYPGTGGEYIGSGVFNRSDIETLHLGSFGCTSQCNWAQFAMVTNTTTTQNKKQNEWTSGTSHILNGFYRYTFFNGIS
jgi:hypothetical protein